MNPISIKDFVFNSSLWKHKPIVATYKNGSIISYGEGGNRHLWLVPDEASKQCILHNGTPFNFKHIWIDTHCEADKFFICYHKDDEVLSIVKKLSYSSDWEDEYNFHMSDLDTFINELIALIR